jgi:hypothetical protein
MAIFVALFFIQGCAGRAARPVKVTQSGDVEKTCKNLQAEVKKYRRNIQKRIPSIKAADKKRTILMISGALLIVPWFFLDFSDADKIEANAVRARHNYLADRAEKLKCRFKVSYLKAFYFHDKGYKKNRNR